MENATVAGNIADPEYHAFIEQHVQGYFATNTAGKPLFTTDVNPQALWQAYLNAFPDAERQHHNCDACRHFIERFGGLALIADGARGPVVESAIWNEYGVTPGMYAAPIKAMGDLVRKAKVCGVFLSQNPVLGHPETGPWRHLSLKLSNPYVGLAMTDTQAMAAKKQDFETVRAALIAYKLDTLERAVVLLESEALYRSEAVLGNAVWLRDLKKAWLTTAAERRGVTSANVLWKGIATAPAGFCHPRSSMIGTLLDDIEANKPIPEVAAAFKTKMRPDKYQRPVAAPSEGNIDQAEKLIEKMGLKPSLKRRYAHTDDVQEWLWVSPAPEPMIDHESTFGHLRDRSGPPKMELPVERVTWRKMIESVLENAGTIEILVPSGPAAFVGFCSAVDPHAPPILQWDHMSERNTVSMYTRHRGSPAHEWGLEAASWEPVTAIVLWPWLWHGQPPLNRGIGLLFAIAGAKDQRNSDLRLFPEILRSELHSIRSTIEAFSKAGRLEENRDGTQVAGIGFWAGQTGHFPRIRVHGKLAIAEYIIDRWE